MFRVIYIWQISKLKSPVYPLQKIRYGKAIGITCATKLFGRQHLDRQGKWSTLWPVSKVIVDGIQHNSFDGVWENVSLGCFGCKVRLSTCTVYPKKYAHGFCFAVLCCGYTLTDFPISIRLTSLALWQSNDCPSASKATLMNMDKYFMWIHYERLHNHHKAKHNKTVCIFLGIYCRYSQYSCHDREFQPWQDFSIFLIILDTTRVAFHLQYIPRNMHTVLLCFALLWLCNRS